MEKVRQSFLPDFCGVRAVLAVVMGSLVLAMVIALAASERLMGFWSQFSTVALYVLWIALLSAGLLCLLRRPLARARHWQAGLAAWLILLAVCLLVAWLTNRLLPVAEVSREDLPWRTLAMGAIVGALVLRYLYEVHLQRLREVAEDQARYQALQARIRPHFLFNSLNTLLSLIPTEPAKAQQILLDLSDLFRATLDDSGQGSTLERELTLVRQYLAVEGLRLGSRLKVSWDLDDLPQDAALPPLLLQPLVENAVYHGIEPAVEGGEIRIYGRRRKGRIILTVANSLPQEGGPPRSGNRMAVENIRQRLAVFFDDQAGLHTGLVDGYYQVRIWFPAREAT